LAGPVVAFDRYLSVYLQPGVREENEIIVRNVATGAVLHRLPTGSPATPPKYRDVGIGPATALVVKRDGAVAWIVEIVEESASGAVVTYQVHAVDSTGSRVLAASSEIEPESLALAGSTLYWMQGGKPQSATLN
jgi:hypothetical protein